MAPKDKNVLMCLSQPHFLKEKEGSVTVSNFVSTFEQKVVVGQWHLVVCFWRAFRRKGFTAVLFPRLDSFPGAFPWVILIGF